MPRCSLQSTWLSGCSISIQNTHERFCLSQSQSLENTISKEENIDTPSPLLKVKWWRIARDETQMVNTPTTTCAKTANEIEAVNRWCISGTPILTDFNDLFGLVYFLRIYPYYSKSWWHHLTIRPIESSGQSSYGGFDQNVLLRLLGDIFWRTEKKDLTRPSCTTSENLSHELTFSDIEVYFYKHQKRACLREYQKKI